jgi:hypothetical protein
MDVKLSKLKLSLFQHGLLGSSADWVMGSPERSLGSFLFDFVLHISCLGWFLNQAFGYAMQTLKKLFCFIIKKDLLH